MTQDQSDQNQTKESELNDETVYNKQTEQQQSVYKINFNEHDKTYLKCLYDEEGFLTTTQIKAKTGLDVDKIGYRNRKFGTQKYIEFVKVEKADTSKLPSHMEQMKQAKLTDRGRELINKGILGNPTNIEVEAPTTQDKEELQKQITEHKEQISELQNKNRSLKVLHDHQDEKIEKLEKEIQEIKNSKTNTTEKIDSIQKEINEIQEQIKNISQWKQRINEFVFGSKLLLQDKDINFTPYIKQAKNKFDNEK